MTDLQSHPLYDATRRVVSSLDRLEGNLKHLSRAMNQGHDQQEQKISEYAEENAILHQERENLNASIAKLQNQYNDLHRVASGIYERLDDSIQKISQIIEE